ncbi:MAG: tRNA G46 methylase TrmB [Myxococcota bacterium]|jgi:tRNA G46 methylase TrmB
MYGTRLYDQPEHAAFAARVRDFCAPGPLLGLEIGVDRGYRLLDHARCWPERRWMGVEIRRTVRAAAEHAPENALLLQADARAVLAALVPDARLSQVDILFPTPSDDPRHLLLTPDLVALLAARMALGGVLVFATDVPAMAGLAEALWGGWELVALPPTGRVRSRREKACEAQGRRVWCWARRRP